MTPHYGTESYRLARTDSSLPPSYFRSMNLATSKDLSEQKAAFAARMHEVCSDLGIVPGRGRQAALGKMFGVTSKAARKWLEGDGYPELVLAIRIADAANVNLTWLLQGKGLKRGTHVDTKALVVSDAVSSLPLTEATEVIHFIEYQITRASSFIAEEQRARYAAALEAMLSERRKASRTPPMS